MPKKLASKKVKRFMVCDICGRCDCKSIITLNPNRFSKRSLIRERKTKRACWRCAGSLFLERKYNFSRFWREAFYDSLIGKISHELESKKAKYMVIHE